MIVFQQLKTRISGKMVWTALFFLWALSAATGLAEDEAEPVPAVLPSLIESVRFKGDIYLFKERVPLENPDVRRRLEKEVLLSLWNRPQVILWLKRASRYFYHMDKIIAEAKLPPDLKYAAVVESALRPHARSSKSAVGYWQFIASTGRRYGLEINSKVDERRNLFESTTAACKYVKDLKKQFGTYHLALAAYNMGENRLEKEIKSQHTRDFYSLYLPLETQRYLLKIVAVKIIMDNPAAYGFHMEKSDLYPALSFDRVNLTTDRSIPLYLIAVASGASFKAIKDLNPAIRGYDLGKGSRSILIPKGGAVNFKKAFSSALSRWETEQHDTIHVVKKGETLSRIARKHHISLAALLKQNNFSRKHIIHPGDRLIIRTGKPK